MSRLSDLPPDQRAVLQLLLQKNRSYTEIAQLLRLDAHTVRARAHDAVGALVPDEHGLTEQQRGELSDFLLGEQSATERSSSRALLESSPQALGWTRAAAQELGPIAADRLPSIPHAATAAPAPGNAPIEPPALTIPPARPVGQTPGPGRAEIRPPAPASGAAGSGSSATGAYGEVLPPPAAPSAPAAPATPAAPVEQPWARPASDAPVPVFVDPSVSEPADIQPVAVDPDTPRPNPSPIGSVPAPSAGGASSPPLSSPVASPLTTSGRKPKGARKLAWPITALLLAIGVFLLVMGGYRLLTDDDESRTTADAPALTQTAPTPGATPTPPPGVTGTTPATPTTPTTPSTTPATPPTTTPGASTTGAPTTTTAAPNFSAAVQMRTPSGQPASRRATASLIPQGGKQSIALSGEGLAPTTKNGFYALWFATSRSDAVFLGYTPNVTSNGRLRLFDTLPDTADATQFKQIWVTRESVAAGSKALPVRPGKLILSGDLPR